MSTAVLSPPVERHPLQSRFAALRRRLRFVVTLRGIGWLLTIVLASAAVVGLLDYLVHLPALVRAVALAGMLSGAGFVAYRFLIQPLWARADDLTLALRIEERYPTLNDCLASTVQFLEQPNDSEQFGSSSMRREAVQRALNRAQGCDFNRVVDTRGVGAAVLALTASGAVAALLFLWNPAFAQIALLRLANPFGTTEWPRKTQLEIAVPRSPIGRNEPFEVRATVRGVIPDKGQVLFQVDNLRMEEKSYDIVRSDDEPGIGHLTCKPPDLTGVQRRIRFQVRANDAVSDWYQVVVLSPPLLAPLEGRASPLVRLQFPAYTDLAEQNLPDGTGNVVAVAGTRVLLRAAANRPLARAWIEYQPDPKQISPTAFLGALGSRHPHDALALTAGGQAVWDRVFARLESDRVLSVAFLPRVSGHYALHFEDEAGLHNQRTFELRVLPDPAPKVNLERPSKSRDLLSVLPSAELPLRALVEDLPPTNNMAVHAVRSVYLEYRCKKDDPPRRLMLYDHQTAGLALSMTFASLGGAPLKLPEALPRLRPQRLQIAQRLSLAHFRHLERGRPALREGDILTLQICAADFDDISVGKEPGRSEEIEIRIIAPNDLQVILNQEQAKLQQDLVKLREQQREALKKAAEVERRWLDQDRVEPKDIAQLLEVEQIQQQIREKVGLPQEGMRADVARLLEAYRNNQLPRAVAQERLEEVRAELERLAREELQQIEPRLTNARLQNEQAAEKGQAPRREKDPLGEARQHQQEVEKTLSNLLERLEPWSSTQELKGEARSILQEQTKLNDKTEQLKPELLGKVPKDLPANQQRQLNDLKEDQAKLEERTNRLLGQMQRQAEARQEQDPQTAQKLRDAHKQATDPNANIAGQMRAAREQIEANQLSQASQQQKEGMRNLDKMIQTLEDRREPDLDRLVKKMRELENKVADLIREQEELQKKIQETAQNPDAQKREEELKRLARRQRELQKKQQEVQDMLQQLSRQRGERARQAMAGAERQMEQALRQLERGQNPAEAEEELLNRLDEVQRELERAREQAEEELAREQLAKVADEIKRLKERQAALMDQVASLNKDLSLRKKEEWRGLLIALGNLRDPQKGLGQETINLAEKKLAGAPIFARVLKKSAEAMEKAGDSILEHRTQVNDKGLVETEAGAEVKHLQQEALRRLEQLLDAIKAGSNGGQRLARGNANPGGGEGNAGQGGGEGDGIPSIVQLMLLRNLQADVNKRTEQFSKQHPDLSKLTVKQKNELQVIRREQQEVAELLDQYLNPEPQGDK